ncbi:MAG: hypothetical protein H0X51_06955 [Parachlamydiaceae bacterium]|nr:hypothetical protein [Parachlamydiaceae bacterium]
MNAIPLKIFFCITFAAIVLYIYIDKQNDLTELRLEIPALEKEVKRLQEHNTKLKYEINQFESPIHLMELAHKPEFGHLRYPYTDKIITLPQGVIPEEQSAGSK